MLESLLGELDLSQNALNLIVIFIQSYIDGIEIPVDSDKKKKEYNLLCLIYIIKLISVDIKKKKNIYYRKMIKEKYKTGC